MRVRSAQKRSRLGGLAGGLRQLARRVVTDRNDAVNSLTQMAGTISRQRTLQARNLEAGFGMKRWSPEMFERKVDAALRQAGDLMAEYRKAMPWVTAVISKGDLKMQSASPRWEGLAGRAEYVAIEITNDLQRAQRFSISGEAAGKEIVPRTGTVAPLSTAYAFVEFTASKAGTVDISLRCAVGENIASGSWPVSVKPSHKLTLNIVNASTGKPGAARAFIRGSDGRYAIAGLRPIVLAGERSILKFGVRRRQRRGHGARGPGAVEAAKGLRV